MITGVAFVPQAPALDPAIGRGLDAELGPVRDACRAAVRRVATPDERIVVVALGDGLAGFGPAVEVATVGEWLVRDALGDRRVQRIVPDGSPAQLREAALHGEDPVALVVVGDGSAARTEKAPGYLHPGAAEFDAAVATTLRAGDGAGLHFPLLEADPALLAAGVHAWAAAAWALEPLAWDAEVLYDDAPFGVGYVVAVWTRRA